MKSVLNDIAKRLKKHYQLTIKSDSICIYNVRIEEIAITVNVIIYLNEMPNDTFLLRILMFPITNIVNHDNLLHTIHDLNRNTPLVLYYFDEKNIDLLAFFSNVSRKKTVADDVDFLLPLFFYNVISTYPTIMKANWQ